MGVLAAVRSVQMMALMGRRPNLLNVLGRQLRQPLGHAAAAAEGAAASSDLSELLGPPFTAGTTEERSKSFPAAAKGNLGGYCMVTDMVLLTDNLALLPAVTSLLLKQPTFAFSLSSGVDVSCQAVLMVCSLINKTSLPQRLYQIHMYVH